MAQRADIGSLTFCEDFADGVVQLGVTSLELAVFARPVDRVLYEALARRLAFLKRV